MPPCTALEQVGRWDYTHGGDKQHPMGLQGYSCPKSEEIHRIRPIAITIISE